MRAPAFAVAVTLCSALAATARADEPHAVDLDALAPARPAPTPLPPAITDKERDRPFVNAHYALWGGLSLIATNYSWVALMAAASHGETPPANRDALYIPVIGPIVALANGQVKFSDGGPLPIFDAMFQGFGVAAVLVGAIDLAQLSSGGAKGDAKAARARPTFDARGVTIRF